MVENQKLKKKSEYYFDCVSKKRRVIKEPQRCYPYVVDAIKGYSGKLLDIGCGEGVLIESLHQNLGSQYDLFGVDISNSAIEIANARLHGVAEFQQGDSEHLPYCNNSFDVIVCTHSFHHYPNPDMAINEMRRCLKKNGTVCIVENYRAELPRRIRNMMYIILNHPNGDIRFYSQEELGNLLGGGGFCDISSSVITKKSFLIIGHLMQQC